MNSGKPGSETMANAQNSTTTNTDNKNDKVEELRLKRSEREDYSPDMIESNIKPKHSCHRCHRLKKKCSRGFPKCSYCVKTLNDCFYVKKPSKYGSIVPSKIPNVAQAVEEHVGANETPATTSRSQISGGDLESMKVNWIQKDGEDTSKSLPILPPIKSIFSKNLSISSLLVDSPEKPQNETILTKPYKRNLNDEFINLKSFHDVTTPVSFVYNYFHNYEYHYPIFNNNMILEEIKHIDFGSESIVNFQIYLILSIGCLITDSTKNTKLFDQFFNDSILESIIDITNFNQDQEIDLNNLKLLILLTIYYSHKKSPQMMIDLVLLLNKLVMKYDFYKISLSDPLRSEKLNIFWSVINLDYELNFITNKPSNNSLNLELLLKSPNSKVHYLEQNLFSKQLILLHLLQNKLNTLKLITQITDDTFKVNTVNINNPINVDLKAMSHEIDVWRHETCKIISQIFINNEDYLKQFDHFINLNYFYLTIELDQLSSTKSSEFTSQFLYHYFALTLAIDKNKNNNGISLNNYLNLKKLFNVVSYNLTLLKDAKYVTSFKNNVSLIVTLLRFLDNNYQTINQELIGKLESLNNPQTGIIASEIDNINLLLK